MYRRPLSVTFVGSILCILGVLSGLDVLWLMSMKGGYPHLMAMEDAPISAVVQIGIVPVSAVITFICGVFVLKGANWARWLYPICFVGLVVILEITSGDKFRMVPTVMMHVALILFLFLPKANDYFRASRQVP